MRTKIAIAALSLACLAACGKPEAEKEKAPAPVQVTAVTQATIRRIVGGDGALFPIEQASLMPKIAAPVRKFYVNRGDHVKKGQLLAVLENRDLVGGRGGKQRRRGAGGIQSAGDRRRHGTRSGGESEKRSGFRKGNAGQRR